MNWSELTRLSQDEVIAWAELQPWSQAMAECQQDAQWHAEGDVWTHTKMVCQQLRQLDEWASLDSSDRQLLLLTALFHDAAKPATTIFDPESGHLRSPHHAVRGEHLVRNVLRQLDCPLDHRERVCSLVRYHGRPAFLVERDDPAGEVIRMSWLSNNRLLYLFALADTRGRKTTSDSRPEENLLYWKLVAEENECLDRPYSFATDHARYLYFKQPEPNLLYVPHEDFACSVTMMCGLPGSGKDTWLAKYHPDLPVVSLDEIRKEFNIDPTDDQGRVIQTATERCRQHLRSGTSFAFNATNLLRQTRSRWTGLFADYNAQIHLVYLEPPLSVLLRQNRNREAAVPESVIQKLAAKVEPPTWLEGHTVTLSTAK
ncbi:AAA family ATPase [Stieleria varia]|uniref:HD domain protein n=1 Tax=Stieleria varia TaxID=2528005 RepID=A0A5C5ZZ56_9BACT|nr:AAA family ATPase [Stieleria varia]TWT92436.1 HD domain protein [Stieleria varia]